MLVLLLFWLLSTCYCMLLFALCGMAFLKVVFVQWRLTDHICSFWATCCFLFMQLHKFSSEKFSEWPVCYCGALRSSNGEVNSSCRTLLCHSTKSFAQAHSIAHITLSIHIVMSPTGGGHRGSSSFPADYLGSRLLSQTHGGPQRPQTWECPVGCQQERQDSWLW